MIAYPVRYRVIERLARKRRPGWFERAAERTALNRAARQYLPTTEFWRDVKGVFVTAQYSKCAYCEMKLEPSGIEWDLEHFRPKGNVRQWHYDFDTGAALPEGYYLLAYDLANYLAACKTCNTIRKSDYFPVRAARVIRGRTVPDHDPENAWLIHPFGNVLDDPEACLEFLGAEAKPRAGSVRGKLLIDFFDLNRDGLQTSRAQWLIHSFYHVYSGALNNNPRALRTLAWMLSHKAPHTNCTRCFYRLCLADPDAAERQYAILEKIAAQAPTV